MIYLEKLVSDYLKIVFKDEDLPYYLDENKELFVKKNDEIIGITHPRQLLTIFPAHINYSLFQNIKYYNPNNKNKEIHGHITRRMMKNKKNKKIQEEESRQNKIRLEYKQRTRAY